MNVLLAVPPYQFSEFYPSYMARKTKIDKGFGLIPGASEPLGLLYIASALKQDGHKVWILDGLFNSTSDFIGFIRENNPDILGITVFSFAWEKTKLFLAELKKHFPGLLTIAGGPFPVAWQERCLQECPELDFVCSGEGEYIMQKLCRCFDNRSDFGGIKGIIWRDKENRVIKNEFAPLIDNLDDLPFPAREMVDVKKYIPSIGFYKRLPNATIAGSRGCNYNCLFCHTQTMGYKVRSRSPMNIFLEIEELVKKYGIKDIVFWDNNLTEDKERITQLCEKITKHRIKITWSGNTRADTVDTETLKVMRKAGCRRLLLGIESGVQKNLDILRKGETLGQIEHAVKLCKKLDIETFATFIFGIPGETYGEGLETVKFSCKLNPDYAKFFSLACHPGTNLYRDLDKYGAMVSFADSQSHQNAGFVPYTMRREDIKKLLNLAYRTYYLRFRYILMKLIKIRSIEDLRQDIRGFLAFINTPRYGD